MSLIRRHMRVCVAVWSLGQGAMLTALLPRDCCAAHPAGAHARVLAEPHEPAGAEPCPMGGHETPPSATRETASATDARGTDEASTAPTTTCTLRAVCNSPLAARASLLSSQDITPDTVTLAADHQVRLQPPVPIDAVRTASRHPDPPPPRA